MAKGIEKISLSLRLHADLSAHDEAYDEEFLNGIFEGIASMLESYDAANETEDIEKFFASIRAAFLAEKYKEKSPEVSYGMGAVWGAVGVYDSFARHVAEKNNDAVRRLVLENYSSIFAEVMKSPGITHSELAERCQKSKSRLTQIVSDIDEYDLLASVRNGREKHYYLTEYAEEKLSPPKTITNVETYCYNSDAIGFSSNYSDIYDGFWETRRKSHASQNMNDFHKWANPTPDFI